MTEIELIFMTEFCSRYRSIEYRFTTVEYQDGFSGERLVYHPSFTVVKHDGEIEHIEVLPASEQMPLTKHLYAQNMLPNWRMISKEELVELGVEDCEVPNWW